MKLPKTSGVYAIIHTGTGRAYIGSSKNILVRCQNHRSSLRSRKHHNPHLQNAWNKYGESAFQFTALELCLPDPIALCAREFHWMRACSKDKELFNSNCDPDPHYRRPLSEAHKQKIRMANTGKPATIKGSQYHGKLSESDMIEIATRYANFEPASEIAKIFGCHRKIASKIIRGYIGRDAAIPPEVREAGLARLRIRDSRVMMGKRRKLNPSNALALKTRMANGETDASLSRETGLSRRLLGGIRKGQAHKYLPPLEELIQPSAPKAAS